uniref:SH3 domain-containing protein n=1 Tax=Noctiluca scintillans TaxID=2966 RepID=A0A7S1F1V0_NOCSC
MAQDHFSDLRIQWAAMVFLCHERSLVASAQSFQFVRAVTVKPHYATDESQLTLAVDDVIYVLEQDETGWWGGHKEGEERTGWFPGVCVQTVVEDSVLSHVCHSQETVVGQTISSGVHVQPLDTTLPVAEEKRSPYAEFPAEVSLSIADEGARSRDTQTLQRDPRLAAEIVALQTELAELHRSNSQVERELAEGARSMAAADARIKTEREKQGALEEDIQSCIESQRLSDAGSDTLRKQLDEERKSAKMQRDIDRHTAEGTKRELVAELERNRASLEGLRSSFDNNFQERSADFSRSLQFVTKDHQERDEEIRELQEALAVKERAAQMLAGTGLFSSDDHPSLTFTSATSRAKDCADANPGFRVPRQTSAGKLDCLDANTGFRVLKHKSEGDMYSLDANTGVQVLKRKSDGDMYSLDANPGFLVHRQKSEDELEGVTFNPRLRSPQNKSACESDCVEANQKIRAPRQKTVVELDCLDANPGFRVPRPKTAVDSASLPVRGRQLNQYGSVADKINIFEKVVSGADGDRAASRVRGRSRSQVSEGRPVSQDPLRLRQNPNVPKPRSAVGGTTHGSATGGHTPPSAPTPSCLRQSSSPFCVEDEFHDHEHIPVMGMSPMRGSGYEQLQQLSQQH